MIRLFILVIFFISGISFHHLRAQSYSAVHYDTKDGLPSTTVYDISQDKDGFIWFGTENGLCRFDGKNFKTYTTKDGLPDNSILKVHGDNTGKLFFTPFTHGLYYHQNDSFFKVPVPDKYKVDLSTMQAFVNKGNKVIIAGITNLYTLEKDHWTQTLDKYYTGKDFLYLRIYDTLMVVQTTDSMFFIPDSGKARAYFSPSKKNEAIVLDRNAQKRQLHIKYKPRFFTIKENIRDSIGCVFIDNVVTIFDMSTGDLLYKIKSDKPSDALLDNENNFWVSTLGGGVYRYPSFGFTNMHFEGKDEIFSLLPFNGRLMVGTGRSQIFSIPLKGDPSHYSTADYSAFIEASDNTPAKITKANRVYVLRSEGNNLYIGTDAFLLKKTGSAPLVFNESFAVKDIEVGDKNILVCTSFNVVLLDKQTLSVKDTLLNQRATCGITYQGDYYIGTLGGLIKINIATKKVTELYNLFAPFKVRIVALKKGVNDDLWVATSGYGLVQFKNGKIIRTLKEQDGLTTDICTSLFVDSMVIWLGTSKGLNRIETGKEKPAIMGITSANGLSADFINTIAVTDSNVYAGTAEGITTFNKNILKEKSVCILHVLQVRENNKTLETDSSYSFPHNAINIQVDFTAISFKSAGDITYYYKLDGLDEDWNTTTNNFVNFPTLQPNNYTFYLKAVNKFGVESDTKTIRISILPPWWQTWLFRIIAIAMLALVVLLIYSYNVRAVKRKEETKREIEARFAALEQKALQAQMNPHFIFNSLNSIQTFILNLDVEGANTYLTNFASLIRQTLDNSMHAMISVASEIKYLETYLSLEKLRFRDKFRHEIRVDEEIDQYNTILPGMLLQPYIENSLRHGIQHRKDNDGLISLTVSKADNNSVLYTITDNGVGRKKAEELKSARHIEYQSRGTSINQKRIAAINSQFKTNIRENTEDIVDATGLVVGTMVTVWIPPLHK